MQAHPTKISINLSDQPYWHFQRTYHTISYPWICKDAAQTYPNYRFKSGHNKGVQFMSFGKPVESLIKEAQERGEFDNLPGKGKPIDLTSYFETPEDVRLAQSVLKNAGMTSPEVQLLKEIAQPKELLKTSSEDQKTIEIRKQIQEKQIEFNLMMERRKSTKTK